MSSSLKKYVFLKKIALGSTGRILLVRNRESGKPAVLKMMNKETVEKKRNQYRADTESAILKGLQESSNPFVVRCFEAFSTIRRLYLAFEYLGGGDIFNLMTELKHFPHEQVKLYSAELVLAVMELHRHQIIHRDLKPENIMLRFNGHLVLTDFGHSEKLTTFTKSTKIAGTQNFTPPEMYLQGHYGYEGDWFQLGVVIYEMYCGENPFQVEKMKTKSILTEQLMFPCDHSIPLEAKNLMKKLLKTKTEERLGFGSENNNIVFPVSHPLPRTTAYNIMNDEYFKATDWNKVYNLEYIPVYVPRKINPFDVKYFDVELAKNEDSFLKEDKNNYSSCYSYSNFNWCSGF